MSKIDGALARFDEGFNCAQAILSAYCEIYGMDMETALKLSCGFGGGMGRMAETCGAVSGAFLVIGLKHGKYKAEDAAAKEKTYELVQEFAGQFRELNGSIKCKELLGCDIGTPEGMECMREKGLSSNLCRKFVADSAGLLEKMLGIE